jgi:hypothetical protein
MAIHPLHIKENPMEANQKNRTPRIKVLALAVISSPSSN